MQLGPFVTPAAADAPPSPAVVPPVPPSYPFPTDLALSTRLSPHRRVRRARARCRAGTAPRPRGRPPDPSIPRWRCPTPGCGKKYSHNSKKLIRKHNLTCSAALLELGAAAGDAGGSSAAQQAAACKRGPCQWKPVPQQFESEAAVKKFWRINTGSRPRAARAAPAGRWSGAQSTALSTAAGARAGLMSATVNGSFSIGGNTAMSLGQAGPRRRRKPKGKRGRGQTRCGRRQSRDRLSNTPHPAVHARHTCGDAVGARARRAQEVVVLLLPQNVRGPRQSRPPFARAHGREAIQVRRLRDVLLAKGNMNKHVRKHHDSEYKAPKGSPKPGESDSKDKKPRRKRRRALAWAHTPMERWTSKHCAAFVSSLGKELCLGQSWACVC